MQYVPYEQDDDCYVKLDNEDQFMSYLADWYGGGEFEPGSNITEIATNGLMEWEKLYNCSIDGTMPFNKLKGKWFIYVRGISFKDE
jgi:hypothetical protein